ncbi:MAG: YbhB/YbcL family Raf kinase inhibitor-like protein [Bacteroidia bacterium]|nr:YbhB/YbcL family Raf kinase inhibitor-like protein [Bacteroidia bacterium]
MALAANTTLKVKSPAFSSDGAIPDKYTCTGENINPELLIDNIPKDTKSLALIMDDRDAALGAFVHWVMWNIHPKGIILQNSSPGAQGINGKNENKYTGPCPPNGKHHYHFKVYALNTKLDLPLSTSKGDLLKAMEGHVLGSGGLVGIYKKP